MTVRELIMLLERHDPETPVLYHTADYDSEYDVDVEKVVEKWGKKERVLSESYPDDYGWDVFDSPEHSGFEKVVILE